MQIDEYLKVNGVTQAAFAEKVGVSQGMVWQWLNDKRPISAESAVRIETATDGAVSRAELRPDLWGEVKADIPDQVRAA